MSLFILGTKILGGVGGVIATTFKCYRTHCSDFVKCYIFKKTLAIHQFLLLQVFLASLASLFSHHCFWRRWLNSLEKLHSSPSFLMSCQPNNQAMYHLSNNLNFFGWRRFGQTIPFGNFSLHNSSSTRHRICWTIKLFWYWSFLSQRSNSTKSLECDYFLTSPTFTMVSICIKNHRNVYSPNNLLNNCWQCP